MTRPLTIVPRRVYLHGIDAGRAIAAFIPLPNDFPILSRSVHVHARASRAALIYFSLYTENQDLMGYGILSVFAVRSALPCSETVWALWAHACGAVARVLYVSVFFWCVAADLPYGSFAVLLPPE